MPINKVIIIIIQVALPLVGVNPQAPFGGEVLLVRGGIYISDVIFIE